MGKFNNIMKYAGYITVTGGFSMILYVSYLLFYTPPYFESKQPYKLSKKEYRIGETLEYTSSYCKYRDYIPLKVERNLVDGFVYPLPVSSVSLGTFPTGCRDLVVSVPLVVSDTTPVNKKYHLEVIVEYKINILQNQTRKFITEDFVLLKE